MSTWIRISALALLFAIVATVSLTRDRGPGKPVATKLGATSQGREFAMKLDADGRPVSFTTSLAAQCPTGRMVEVPWEPVDGDGVRFQHGGGRLHLLEKGEGFRQEIDARVSDTGRLTGTMTLVVHVRPKTRAPFDCTSPRVRVTAGR